MQRTDTVGLAVAVLSNLGREGVPVSDDATTAVLFVDDESSVLRAITHLARGRPWRPIFASSTAEARDVLATTDLAAVVSDYHLGDEDGVDFLAEVGSRWPHPERILMTGQPNEEALQRAINVAGIQRYVVKPWENASFIQLLDDAVAQNQLKRANTHLARQLKDANERLRQANEQLQNSVEVATERMTMFEQRWETAFNAISEPVIIVDHEFRWTAGNDAALALAGCDPPVLNEGRFCHQALFASLEPCATCPITGGHTGSIEGGGSNTQHCYEARAYPLPDGRGYLCIYHDVTEEVVLRRQVAHIDKMAAVGRLASRMAHELNNPLHAISAFAKLASGKDVPSEKMSRYLTVITESAARCAELIQAVRTYARPPASSRGVSIRVELLCKSVLEIFHALDHKNVELVLEDEDPRILGNQNQLQQVLTNLVQNALDASPKGGKVLVRVSRDGDKILIAVEDQGPGVRSEERERIFEPFFTTKPEGVGTGLGLAICHSAMTDHRGGIRVDQSPTLGGARFEVWLPRELDGEG